MKVNSCHIPPLSLLWYSRLILPTPSRSLVTHSAHWGRLCSVVCLSVLPFPFLTLVTLSLLFVPPSARSLGSSSVLPSCPSFTRHERTKGVSDEWGARMTSASHLSYRSPSHRRLS